MSMAAMMANGCCRHRVADRRLFRRTAVTDPLDRAILIRVAGFFSLLRE